MDYVLFNLENKIAKYTECILEVILQNTIQLFKILLFINQSLLSPTYYTNATFDLFIIFPELQNIIFC